MLPRERKPSSSSEGTPGSDRGAAGGGTDGRDRDRDNPFAAPPAGTPDREWRPRHAHSGHPEDSGDSGSSGSGDSKDGSESSSGSSGEHDGRHAWGNQWSSQQPGRQGGGFGSRPGRGGPEGQGGSGGPGQTGLRWDPTDPAQRRARYALLSGMWAFFFSLFSLPEIALLLGALALYWGISALRAKPRAGKPGQGKPEGAKATAADIGSGGPSHDDVTPTAGPPHATAGNTGAPAAQGSSRPQTTAALSGLVTACLALCIVAAGFTFQLVYKDYYTCVNDALTQSARHSCEDLLPEQLRPILSVQE
ncbi:hypothetical protein ABT381_29605 [Streptomyces sp. NPDC000151]|uniref:hypothetical protein n=1 Tax=Streptomyces sp. NPDC000151 TaxID=3154244 RepID=UPI00332C6D55